MDIWSILIILGIAQGLFTLSVLYLRRKDLGVQNSYLIFIVLLFIWFQLEFLSIRNVFNVPVNLFYGTRHGSWLLLGPLVIFYLKSITQSEWKLRYIDVMHLAPFLLFAIILPLIFTDFLGFRQIHYGMLTVFDSWNEVITPFQYLYSSVFIIQFVHLCVYLFNGFGLLSDYTQKLKLSYSAIDEQNIVWVRIFIYGMMAILVVAAAFLATLFFTNIYRRHLDYLYVLPMGVLTYLLGYKLSGVKFASNVQQPLVTKEPTEKYEKSSLKPSQVEVYTEALESHMEENKPYLNNDLRLQDLAEALNIPGYHLSQVLNQHLNTSFFDFINQHRINEAKQLMRESPKATLLQIAYDAGFNNKTSFVNAFKKFEGTTPSVYFRMVS